ncbi:esterase/lipase [Gloeomargarita lithophora Alchichica-D10]|uniref:Esterase/lipase n=1 Tax=Gloeomargarita lithophora Alchichica-D10 TaxID=1188229 RepID=A0A1J0AC64_9CYAN|nr:alpha/beta hydrolase [Gloeomargarita lithophora]APB33511.1 esterase/lipase [Gloeomargarita lithophora Alchichica-D10]
MSIYLEPEAQAFAEATAQPPYLFELEPHQGRKIVDEVQSSPVSKPLVKIEDIVIPVDAQNQVPVRVIAPPDATDDLPVIVYIHGAGWVFGNAHTHDRLMRELAVGVPAKVIFPEYSLSPEAKYPTAIEENYTVLQWAAAQTAQRLAVAGDSVGGNMAIALTLMAKQRGGAQIDQQLLFYPVTDAAFETPSYEQFATGYFLQREAMRWFWEQYTTDPQQRAEITASPLRATLEQLQGLPPALVITAEADVLRDEGEAYANRLRQAGVRVTAARFQGTIHDFVMLNALAETTATRGAMALAIRWLQAGLWV